MTPGSTAAVEAACEKARALLAEGDAREAFTALRPVLGYPAMPEDAALGPALKVLSAIAAEIAGDHLSSLLGWAAGRLDDSDALYDAAYALYEQKLHDLAATLLMRADRAQPGSTTIVTELSANLEALLLHAHAAAVLRASGLCETDATCAYLYGYNALLSGDVEAARPVAQELRGLADGSLAYMGAALSGMVARADALRGATPLDARDLAGWHLVINGAVLLHLSPYGFEEAMRGRYAYVTDTYARIREGLDRLALTLSTAQIPVTRVLSLPDRPSRIVARAAAELFDVPFQDFPEGGDQGRALVVAYDLDCAASAGVLERLREHRPGQVLFAHASCWTDPFPYAPDVTTYLYQANVAPWDGGGLMAGPDAQAEPDESTEDVLSARIIAASGEHESRSTDEQLAALVAGARRLTGDGAAGLFRASGQRLRQRLGSPVWSNRFT
jgi:hypothetical protein